MKYLFSLSVISVLFFSTQIFGEPSGMSFNDYYKIVSDNNIDELERLKKSGFDFNTPEKIYGQTVLDIAVQNRKTDIVLWLLSNGADINVQDGNYRRTPLLSAVNELYNGNTATAEIIRILLKNNADVNITDIYNHNALILISRKSYDQEFNDIYDKIISDTENINAVDENGNSALIIACSYRNTYIAEKLVEMNTDVNIKNRYGQDALFVLCSASQASSLLAEKLIKKGAEINGTDNDNHTILVQSISNYSENNRTLSVLLSSGVIKDTIDEEGYTPLYYACTNKRIPGDLIKKLAVSSEIINSQAGYRKNTPAHEILSEYNPNLAALDVLIKAGADLNIRNIDGSTVLHTACRNSNINDNTIMTLLKNKSDINARDNLGDTPLHVAVKNSDFDKIKLLVQNKADINSKNINGDTPLHSAAQIYDKEKRDRIISFLCTVHADINAVNINNETPLLICFKENYSDSAGILIQNGADITIPDKNKNNLFHFAAMQEDTNIFEIVEQKNVLINDQNSDGNTPLHFAFHENQFNTAEYLMKNGANPLIENNDGLTPLDITLNGMNSTDVIRLSENEFLNDYFSNDSNFSERYRASLIEANDNISRQKKETRSRHYRNIFYMTAPPVAILSGAVYFREFAYSDNPMDNNFAYVSSISTCLFSGAMLGGIIGAIITPKGSGYMGGLTKVVGFLVGAGVGAIAGTVTGVVAVDYFKENRFLYYAAPVTYAVVTPLFVFDF